MKNRLTLFICVVLLQLGFLFYTAASTLTVLETGDTVRIKCVPVDPRSLVSGDYVDLRYTISSINPVQFYSLSQDISFPKAGDSIYIRLSPDRDGFAEISGISDKNTEFRKEGAIYARAKVISAYSEIELSYGIEHYFVPQFSGHEIENSSESAHVEAAAGRNGRLVLKGLFVEGKKVNLY